MAITYCESRSDPARHNMVFDVTRSGMTITVCEGSATFMGSDASLSEDWDAEIPLDATYDRTISGFLVKKISDGSIEVLVDIFTHDGVDVSYSTFLEDGYEPLSRIYMLEVPADTSDLSGLDMLVWKTVAPS